MCFNPRPPITAGESNGCCAGHGCEMGFQSAPANYGGRIQDSTDWIFFSYQFQSAPANYGGRINILANVANKALLVSIRARQLRRANRPAPAEDDAEDDAVSIRARQLRRANPLCRSLVAYPVMFQSAPANYGGRILFQQGGQSSYGWVSIRARQLRRANRSLLQRVPSTDWMFQSAPANYGGRIRIPAASRSPDPGFNPRPPIAAGESTAPRRLSGQSRRFQSAPANYGGRIDRRRRSSAGRKRFNPRPPITAGESGTPPPRVTESNKFQSAPANYGGRILNPL